MGKLRDLQIRDIKLANSLGRVLALLDLDENDLIYLKKIPFLLQENKDLKEKIVSLENEVDRLSRAYNFESYSISEKGEHLNE